MKRNLQTNIILRKRRGLHTLIGAVFFVLIMGSTIAYVTYSMDLVDDMAYQVDVAQDINLNRQNEEFILSDVEVVSNEFNLTVANTGTLPINITKMWAKNITDSTWNQTSYTINQVMAPGSTLSNIGVGSGLTAMDSESYSLKLLTSRGNALETQVFSPSNSPLEMTMVATPVNPVGGEDVNAVFTVKNNLTNGAVIPSITPQIDFDDGTATVTQVGTVVPPSYQGLKPGQSVNFHYTFDVAGDEDETAIFNATIANAVQGNFATDTSSVIIVPMSFDSLESELSKSFGKLFLNYTTFEHCEDSGSTNCESDSSDWESAWQVKKNRNHMYRINVTNTNDTPYWIYRETGIMMLQAADDGNWDSGKMFFVLGDNTPTDEGPNAYSPNSKKLPCCDAESTVYFGAAKVPYDGLALTYDKNGVLAVFMLFYLSDDVDDDGYNGNDPKYSQNLPFQAIQTY